MDCSGAWATGMAVDPVLFFLFVGLMMLACILGTLLMNVLLDSQDKQVSQAHVQVQGSAIPVKDTRIGMQQVASVLFVFVFVGLFYVGMHHY